MPGMSGIANSMLRADTRSEGRSIAMAQCETCGLTYDGKIERCPRCQSNQKILRHLHENFARKHGDSVSNVRVLFSR